MKVELDSVLRILRDEPTSDTSAFGDLELRTAQQFKASVLRKFEEAAAREDE